MPNKKRLAGFAAIFLISTIIGLSLPVHVHRRDFDKAFFRWYRERTPAAATLLEAESLQNQKILLETKACCGLIIFTLCSGTWLAGEYLRGRTITH